MNKCFCGSSNSRIIFSGTWLDNLGKLPFKLRRCDNCQIIRTDPPPASTLSDSYLSEREENEKLWESFARDLIKFIGKASGKRGGKLLDIGCSIGLFVKVARDSGFDSVGIDIDKKAIEYGKKKFGINLKTTSLEKSGFKKQTFDIVVLSHTLEHVKESKKLLRNIKNILKQDGILIIEVPNINGLPVKLQKLRGENWYGYDARHHLWHFSPSTISDLLLKCGFNNLTIDTTKSLYYENRGNFIDKIKYLFIRLSEILGKADQIRLVAQPIK